MVRSPRISNAPRHDNPARRAFALIPGALALTLATTFAVGCERSEPAPEAQAIEVATGSDGAAARPSSTAAKKSQYTVRLETTEVTVGKPTPVELVVLPGRDLKINLDFPWKFEFQPGEAVAFENTTVSRDAMTLDDERARVPVTVEARQAGPITIEAVGSFSVCNDDRCDILRDEPVFLALHALDADGGPQGAAGEESGAPAEGGAASESGE